MKKFIIVVIALQALACNEYKEPKYITVTDCASNAVRDTQVCTSPGGRAAGWAIGGALLLGPVGLLAGIPSATQDAKCHMEKENYCERYETKQILNKNYKE